ncbi:MAG: U32 family peptidase, partial [Rhodospirillales bacterium]|nr:U32 family peptidase [Rhodospirillales bacterium]
MAGNGKTDTHLTLGPVQFNWAPEQWRDFYFRMADEAPVDTVYVGEVVCSKRLPFLAPHIPEVVERLQAAGKEVVLSTLALIMTKREMGSVRDICGDDTFLVEANDTSAAALLAGRPHVIGPFVNLFNEGTLAYLAGRGAVRACLPVELGESQIRAMTASSNVDLEVQIFGRLPLAVSARCYHARAHNLSKDNCQYVCAEDPDGMDLDTLDGEPFLAVNGIQTMSYTYANLSAELPTLQAMGVRHFRLWPHTADMVAVAGVYRNLLDGKIEADAADETLSNLIGGVPFANGYFHGVEG